MVFVVCVPGSIVKKPLQAPVPVRGTSHAKGPYRVWRTIVAPCGASSERRAAMLSTGSPAHRFAVHDSLDAFPGPAICQVVRRTMASTTELKNSIQMKLEQTGEYDR